MISKVTVKIKKLHPNAVIPRYAKMGDAGMDMIATSVDHTIDYIEYDTGIAMEIPEGYVGLLFPRSSNSKKDLLLCNSVGVVDSGYRNSIRFRFQPLCPNGGKIYEVGDKIGQIMIIPYPQINFKEVENLSETDRGTSGFGSSGK